MAVFADDVARDWRLAEEEWKARQTASMLGLQVRYALITGSLNQMAGNLDGRLRRRRRPRLAAGRRRVEGETDCVDAGVAGALRPDNRITEPDGGQSATGVDRGAGAETHLVSGAGACLRQPHTEAGERVVHEARLAPVGARGPDEG